MCLGDVSSYSDSRNHEIAIIVVETTVIKMVAIVIVEITE